METVLFIVKESVDVFDSFFGEADFWIHFWCGIFNLIVNVFVGEY